MVIIKENKRSMTESSYTMLDLATDSDYKLFKRAILEIGPSAITHIDTPLIRTISSKRSATTIDYIKYSDQSGKISIIIPGDAKIISIDSSSIQLHLHGRSFVTFRR